MWKGKLQCDLCGEPRHVRKQCPDLYANCAREPAKEEGETEVEKETGDSRFEVDTFTVEETPKEEHQQNSIVEAVKLLTELQEDAQAEEDLQNTEGNDSGAGEL